MPAFVPQCQYDVFISYAQVVAKEWILGFVAKLQKHLDENLEGTGTASIFWDRAELDGASSLTSEITQALSGTAALLIVLSRAYLNRPWCKLEREQFFNDLGRGGKKAFVMFIEDLKIEERPPEIENMDVLGFQFWEPHPASRIKEINWPLPLEGTSFDARIRELAKAIAEHLFNVKTEYSNEVRPNAAVRSRLTDSKVFLADGISGPPVKDLEEARSAVRSWLTDQGAVVLTNNNNALYEAFYSNRTQCEAKVDKLLNEAIIFVQLLGRKGDDEDYESWLCKRAIAAGKIPGKDLLLWRSQLLTSDSIKSDTHRALVFSEQYQVISCDLSEFQPLLAKHIEDIDRKREAQRRLDTPVDKGGVTQTNEGSVTVLIDSEAQDALLVKNLRKQLSHYKIQYEPAMDAQDFCDMVHSGKFTGVTFTYGDCPEEWAKERFKATRPFRLGDRTGNRLCIGVYRDNSPRDLLSTSGIDVIIDGDTKSMKLFVVKLLGRR